MDELLLIYYGDEGDDVDGGKGAIGGESILCILRFSPAPSQNSLRGHISIVNFRSRRFHRGKETWKRAHMVGGGSHHVARKWGHMMPLFSYLVALHVDFFFSRSLFS
jgi:hypothetical protein